MNTKRYRGGRMRCSRNFKKITSMLTILSLVVTFIPMFPRYVEAATGSITVKANTNATDLAKKLVGSEMPIQNAVFVGSGVQAGFFNDSGVTEIEEGVILSTGRIDFVIGPNNLRNKSHNNQRGGDPTLDVFTGKTTYDASVLQFQFKPQDEYLVFQYVFASDEYEEYVNSEYNDAFAFLVNGKNAAIIPGTSEYVSINTVNHQKNSQYYKSNHDKKTYNTEMDGMTTVLKAVAKVNKNEWNTIRLVVADATDQIYDSNVFLKANSFKSVPDPIAPMPPTISIDPETWTNANVQVTIDYADAETKKVYYDGQWRNYTGPFSVSYNQHVYAIGYNGPKASQEVNRYIGNIDKTPPTTPTLTANITAPTNQNVTVTATYPADGTVKQYKIGTGAWTAYTAGIAMTQNGTVEARCQDVAGNWSETTSLVVSNIDKIAPTGTVIEKDSTGKVLQAGEMITGAVTLHCTGIDETSGSGIKGIKLPDGTFINSTSANYSVSQVGMYKFVIIDNAGNETTIDYVTKYKDSLMYPKVKMTVVDDKNPLVKVFDSTLNVIGTVINDTFSPVQLIGNGRINFNISGKTVTSGILTKYAFIKANTAPIYNAESINWTTLPGVVSNPNDFNSYPDLIKDKKGYLSLKHYEYAGNYASNTTISREMSFGQPTGGTTLLTQKADVPPTDTSIVSPGNSTNSPFGGRGIFNEDPNGYAFLDNAAAFVDKGSNLNGLTAAEKEAAVLVGNKYWLPISNEGAKKAMKVWGYFVPSTTATYKFAVHSDDGAYGYLIVNGQKKVFVENWTIAAAFRRSTGTKSGSDAPAKATVSYELEAGKAYPIYMEWFEGMPSHRAFIPMYSINGAAWTKINNDEFYASSNNTPGTSAEAYFEDASTVNFPSEDGTYYVAIKSENTTDYITEGIFGGFIVDNTAPTTPTFTLSPTTPTNGTVNVTVNYPNDATKKQYKIGITGAWTNYTSAIAVTVNETTVYAKCSDIAGNWSEEGSYTVTNIDTEAPAAPTNLALAPISDTGIKGDNITSNKKPTITGKAEAGSTVTLYKGSAVIGTGTAGTDGNFSIAITTDLTEGVNPITAKATDVVGNESTVSSELKITIKSTIEAPTDLALAPISDTGIKGDNITSNKKPTITGKAEAGSTVTLYKGSVVIGTGTASTDGNFSIPITTDLTEGVNTITAKAKDVAGNESTVSSELKITIISTIVAPTDLALADESDTGVKGDNITSNNTPAIIGKAQAGSTVTLYKGSDAIGTGTVGADGNFSVNTSILADGTHIITAKAKDIVAGITSNSSAAVTIIIDTTKPAKPVINVKSTTKIVGTKTVPAVEIRIISNDTDTTAIKYKEKADSGWKTESGKEVTFTMTEKTTVSATAIDQAGNESDTTTQLVELGSDVVNTPGGSLTVKATGYVYPGGTAMLEGKFENTSNLKGTLEIDFEDKLYNGDAESTVLLSGVFNKASIAINNGGSSSTGFPYSISILATEPVKSFKINFKIKPNDSLKITEYKTNIVNKQVKVKIVFKKEDGSIEATWSTMMKLVDIPYIQ